METNTLLYIAFIIYLLIMVLGVLFKIKWLFMIAGLIWFIPIIEIPNVFITVVASVIMIVHFILGFYEPKESEF